MTVKIMVDVAVLEELIEGYVNGPNHLTTDDRAAVAELRADIRRARECDARPR